MTRLLLICWNPAEAEEHARPLRTAGYEVGVHADQTTGAAGLNVIKENPPEAVIIDLDRLPSQGRAVAVWLRQRKTTRHVPIVFAGGAAEKIAQTRKLIPDAVYTEWTGVRGAVRRAMKGAPAKPVVPGAMDGYVGVALAKKLGIKAESVVALLGAPAGFEHQLEPLPPNVRLKRQARGEAHLVMLFTTSQTGLKRRFAAAERMMAPNGGLWIVWPKQASGETSDLTQITVRRFGLDTGLVDYKIARIDKTWSGLLFARRKRRE